MSVEIHVTAGPAKGRSFIFEKPGHLVFGRAPDANISVPDDQYVSRHHFELEIDPPNCILRDLNSINGVFVNGVHYGGRAPLQPGIEQAPHDIKEVSLEDSDQIAVRDTRIKVFIRSTPKEQISSDILMHSKNALVADKEVALFVLNVPQPAQQIQEQGETKLSSLIGNILTKVKRHSSSADLLFLKYMGDGFFMAFPTVSDALSLALTLLEVPVHLDVHIRIALHWGLVKTRPNRDVFGSEVHRVYRIENVQMQSQIKPPASKNVLPVDNRILITKQGLEQLGDSDRNSFKPAGTFQLKGFDESCELWVLYKEKSIKP